MDAVLHQLQQTELEILSEIDALCRKHHIHYSLYAGTLLGAVRHQGFIPWDDDLDLCMSREDYEKFLVIWQKEQPKGYILQNKDNTPSFTQSFTKIRKEHTTFLQYEWEKNRYHTGIFVDIFPLDRMPIDRFRKVIFKLDCMKYQLYTREFIPSKANLIVRFVSKILLSCHNPDKRDILRKKALRHITQIQDSSAPLVGIETMHSLQKLFPADMLDGYVDLEFEGKKFMCFEKWDAHLRSKFGDYMKLPPISERTWTHHPIMIDFERDYQELQEN